MNEIISELDKSNWTEAYDVLKCLHNDIELGPYLQNLEAMSTKGYLMFGLRVDGKLCSVAGCQIIQYLSLGSILWIVDMATLPEERSKGYGKMLLDYIHVFAKERAYCRVLLHTAHSRSDTIRFYDRYFGNSFGLVYRSIIK